MKSKHNNLTIIIIGAIVAVMTIVLTFYFNSSEPIAQGFIKTKELPTLDLMNFNKIFTLLFVE